MPWNGSGVFARVYSWAADRDAGLDILADRMDTDTNDIAQGLMHCLTVNGETVPTANLPMANYRHTGASAGVALTDYVTLGQLQNGGGGLGAGFLPLSGGSLTGPLNVNSDVNVSGVVDVNGNISTNSLLEGVDLHLNGASIVSGAIIAASVYASGIISSNSSLEGVDLHLNGASIIGGAVTASGAVSGASLSVGAGSLACGNIACGGVNASGTVYGPELNIGTGAVTCGNIHASGVIATSSGSQQPGGGPWGVFSDVRLKRAVESYHAGLAEIMRLHPVSYEYNGLGGTPDDGRRFVGLIADEMRDIMPEMVTSQRGKLMPEDAEDTDILTMNAGPLTYALVNAVRELSLRLEALEAAAAAAAG